MRKWLAEKFESEHRSLLKGLLVEIRRTLSVLLMPWTGIVFFCVAASCAIIYFFDLNALIAPVIKAWLLVKAFMLRTLPNWLSVPTLTTKLLGAMTASAAFLVGLIGGWKAWSAKKLARQGARFVASQSARFVASSVGVSLLHGRERKSLRAMPNLIRRRLKETIVGSAMSWWAEASERNKRLAAGLILCLILAVIGHALIGFSILLFDLIWEMVLILLRWLDRAAKVIWPVIRRQLPESLVKLVTHRVVPFLANAIPVIRDDHRVMYMRFNIRLHYRRVKYLLLRYARARRPIVRSSIGKSISPDVRKRADSIIDRAVELADESSPEKGRF